MHFLRMTPIFNIIFLSIVRFCEVGMCFMLWYVTTSHINEFIYSMWRVKHIKGIILLIQFLITLTLFMLFFKSFSLKLFETHFKKQSICFTFTLHNLLKCLYKSHLCVARKYQSHKSFFKTLFLICICQRLSTSFKSVVEKETDLDSFSGPIVY